MNKLVTVAILAVGSTLAAGACSDVCGCSPELPQIDASISGHVFAPDSSPVVGSLVAFEGGIGDCASTDERLHLDDVFSEPDGAYQSSIQATGLDDDEVVCARVRANPPGGSDYGPSSFLEIEFDEADFFEDLSLEHDFYLTEGTP